LAQKARLGLTEQVLYLRFMGYEWQIFAVRLDRPCIHNNNKHVDTK